MKKMYTHEMELGLEVVVEMKDGITLEGKIMDYTLSREIIWVETSEDFYQINTEVNSVFYAPTKPAEVVQTEKAPNSLKTLKELKEAIADELKGQWYEEIESVKVAVYNAEEDGAECWDCEVQIALDNGDTIYPTFGTFFNEKDALAYARDMRVKLNRSTYTITDKVWVYSC